MQGYDFYIGLFCGFIFGSIFSMVAMWMDRHFVGQTEKNEKKEEIDDHQKADWWKNGEPPPF